MKNHVAVCIAIQVNNQNHLFYAARQFQFSFKLSFWDTFKDVENFKPRKVSGCSVVVVIASREHP